MAQEKKDKNFNNENPNAPQSPTTTLAGSGGVSAAGPVSAGNRTAQFSTGASPSKAGGGSGRFTNLNKYLGANEGAGDRLYKGIDTKLTNEYNTGNKEASKQATAVREGIETAQNTLGRGQGYLEQTKKADFDAQKFLQAPQAAPAQTVSTQSTAPAVNPILQDFSGFRTGQNVDVNQLNQQQGQALTTVQNLYNQTNQRAQQAGNELGRFDLLKQTYGVGPKNAYTSGQQRLDNLFLQAGAGNNVGQLQNSLTERVRSTQNLGKQVDQYGNVIGDVSTSQADLAKSLQDQTNLLEGNKVASVESTEAAVNEARSKEQADALANFNSLVNSGEIDSKTAALLDLQNNDRLLNVFQDNNDPNSYLKFNRGLTGANELATTADRNQYEALAQLAGLDQNSYRIKKDAEVAAAVEALKDQTPGKTDQTLLRSRLNDRNVDFENTLKTDASSNLGDIIGEGMFELTPYGRDGSLTSNLNLGQGLSSFDKIDKNSFNNALAAAAANQRSGGQKFVGDNLPSYFTNQGEADLIANLRNNVVNAYNPTNGYFNDYINSERNAITQSRGNDMEAILQAYRTLNNKGAFQRVKVK